MSESTGDLESLVDPISKEMASSRERQGRFATLIAERSMKTIDSLMDEVAYFKDRYIRQRADTDNYVKAKEREVAAAKEYANSDLIRSLLPVLDSVDSAILHEKDSQVAALLKGQILKTLSQYGLKPIETKGVKFDPNFHEAISITDNGDDGMIVEEVQKGYMLKNEVIRTSKVIVGKR